MAGQGLGILQNDIFLFLAIFAGELFSGIIFSSFIVCVNFFEWVKAKTLSSCDQIFLALGVSNIMYPCPSALMLYVTLLEPSMNSISSFQALYALTTFTVMSSSWLTAFLCLFYCLKIVHFKIVFIVRLKTKIDRLTPWLILTVGLVSTASSVPGMWTFTDIYNINKTSFYSVNRSSKSTVNKDLLIFIPVMPNIVLPFLIVMVTTICIICSLVEHTKNIRQHMGNTGNLKVHRRAACTMVCLLLLYFMLYVAETNITLIFPSQLSFEYYGMFILVLAFSPLQTLTLILGNKKLMQNYKKLSHLVLCKKAGHD